MMQQLYRIGNNLNQIAQKAHTLNVIDVQRYDTAVSQLIDINDDLRIQLGPEICMKQVSGPFCTFLKGNSCFLYSLVNTKTITFSADGLNITEEVV